MISPLLEMKNISKSFGVVHALRDISFTLYQGETHCLIGENGAGKSTLIKILSGVLPKDRGTILLKGEVLDNHTPNIALEKGISVIYQDVELVPYLTVAENIFLGHEGRRLRLWLNKNKLYRDGEKLLHRLGFHISPSQLAGELSLAEQQVIAIARAISYSAKIIVMDEPSAVLNGVELDKLFEIIKILKKTGVGVIYISHRLEEVFRIGDRMTVLRDGEKMITLPKEEVSLDDLIFYMVGKKLERIYPERVSIDYTKKKPLLEVRGVSDGELLKDISFSLYPGEILGLAGLVGSGRTQLAQVLFGAKKKYKGKTFLNGKETHIYSPKEAIKRNLGFIPESKKEEGLVMVMSVRDNMSLPSLWKWYFWAWSWRDIEKEDKECKNFIKNLHIIPPSSSLLTSNLSGGNQQKVILSKWLMRNCLVLILDEPTHGIDVGAKVEMYNLINGLSREGKGILFISSEMPELLGMCDRILVMRDGRMVKELGKEEFSQENILYWAIGAKKNGKNEC